MTHFSFVAAMSDCIYALVDDKKRIRYVGRTTSPLKTRLSQHRTQANAGHQPVHEWIRTDPYMEIIALQACPQGKQDTGECELDWIRWLRAKGHPILNVLPYPPGAHPNIKDRSEKEKQA